MSHDQTFNRALIKAMQQPGFYPHAVDEVRLVETHISLVFLTGEYVYKVKKSVNLGFLDFSSLEKRHLYCKEELRLNRRLAKDIYLDVVSIRHDADGYHLDEHAAENEPQTPDICEYAVKMRQFDPSMQFDLLLERGQLKPAHIDQLADRIAAFHTDIAHAGEYTDYGKPQSIQAPLMENFVQIRQHLPDDLLVEHAAQLHMLETCAWQKSGEFYEIFEQRKREGFIRECHGDMHLRNIALGNHGGDDIIIFDCIEFDPNLRWIDVISDLAFTIMDLDARGQSALSWRLLNRYLQSTADHAGLQLLRFYCCYRAMVRAKVAAIETAQQHEDTKHIDAQRAELEHYLQLAQAYTHARKPALMITQGFSASGKSVLSQTLLEETGAIRLRSDVERQRLFPDSQDKQGKVEQGRYQPDKTEQVYQHLHDTAKQLLAQGHKVIVDATFLRKSQRTLFMALANDMQAPFVILSCTADETTLKQRLRQREAEATDVSEATITVLQHQLNHHDAIDVDEQQHCLTYDSEHDTDIDALLLSLAEHGIEYKQDRL